MKKIKLGNIVPMIVIGILFVLGCLSCGNSSGKVSLEAVDPFTLESECAALSDTDILEGAETSNGNRPTVGNYIDCLLGGEFDGKDGALELHSEWLYRMIPIELLTHECTYFHHGKAYSYYIRSYRNTKEYPCASEVFFIHHAPVYNERTGMITLRLKFFSVGYETSNPQDGRPVTVCNAFETDDYYLKDVQFYFGVKNEYEPNYGDEGYDKQTDDGVVLFQTYINYKNMFRRSDNGKIYSSPVNVIDAIVGNMPEIDYDSDTYKDYKKGLYVWIDNNHKSGHRLDPIELDENDRETSFIDYYAKAWQKEDSSCRYYTKFFVSAPQEGVLLLKDRAEMSTILSDGRPAAHVYVGAHFGIYVRSGKGKEYTLLSDGTKIPYDEGQTFGQAGESSSACFDKIMFDKNILRAEEGDNDGYIYSVDGEQIFKFEPQRAGSYIVSTNANHNISIGKEGVPVQGVNEIKNTYAGACYYIHVKPKTASGLGAYKLNIDLAVPNVSVGQTVNKTIAAYSFEYLSLTAPKTDVYTFTCDDINALGVCIEQIDGTELASGVGHVALRLSANTKCYIRLANWDINPKTAAFSVAAAPSLTLSSAFTFMRSTVVRFAPPVSGDYKLDVSSVRDDLRITVRYPDYSVKYRIAGGGQPVKYYEAGEYFIEIECGVSSEPYSLSVELVPIDITSSETNIYVYHEYTVYRFVPNANGKYEFALDGAKLSLYDRNGEDVTDTLLVAGNGYYIAVSQSGTVTISLKMDGSIELVEPYSVKAGNNVLTFTAQESGDYVFAGCGELVVLDDEYGLVTSGKTFGLSSGKMYYLVYTALAAENVILRLTADKLVNYGSIIVTGSGLYELDVDESADYTISVATWTGAPVPIVIYDAGMSVIEQSDDGRIVRTLATGIYFVRVTTEPCNDLVVSVHNSAQDGNVLQCVENKTYAIDLPENGSVVYKWDRSGKAMSAVRLNTNIVTIEKPYINVAIYRLANGERLSVDLASNVEGVYKCALDAEVYFIEFTSTRIKSLLFSVESING